MSGCVGHSSRIIRFLKKEPLRTVGGSFLIEKGNRRVAYSPFAMR